MRREVVSGVARLPWRGMGSGGGSTLHTIGDTLLDAHNAVLEFLLGDAQVLVGVGQVLDLLVELLLDLRELLDAQRIQVDYIREKRENQHTCYGRDYNTAC